ncbi:hypothetical protein CPC16_012149 [Podila verticillata]|nr:hypothetical protein CPC16_012149 [Podila verticillata]
MAASATIFSSSNLNNNNTSLSNSGTTTTSTSITKSPPVLHPITTNTSTEHHTKAQIQPKQHSLPSPPLSSVHPTANSGFFLKSPLQERCEALESELSSLRARLKRSERSSTVREKRLSIFQQQSTDAHHVLNTLRQQHEVTVDQLKDAQREVVHAKTQLQSQKELIQRLETQTQDQDSQLKEVLVDRDSLSMEMMEAHSDNAKFLKRLRTSSDKVEKLQLENRHLIEQLRELRAKVVAVSDEKLELTEILDREKHRSNQASLELEKVVARYKAEVEKLQDLVLMMGNRHVQVQAQLQFLQQQALHLQQRPQQQQTDASTPLATNEHKALVRNSLVCSPSTTTLTSTSTKHGSLMLGDGAITSILASVATSSHARRSKPTRRFTVNASHQEAPLTLEQRKCEFLMDQITVLQRGYDTLRQDKVTLELQVDLMQRQHQYHQQQRQKRRESQRRTLGSEQSAALSTALANMNMNGGTMVSSPVVASPFVTGPLSIMTRIPSEEELKLAQLRAQKELEAQEKEKERLAAEAKAKAAAEEAERQEAIRQKKLKDIHLKEALASLESKRGRSDSRNVTFTSSEELKHLEHLRLTHQEEINNVPGSPVNSAFQSAANARASRRIASPKQVAVLAHPTSTPPPSPFFATSSSSFFSSAPSPLSAAPTPASSFSSAYAPEPVSSSPLKQHTHNNNNNNNNTPYTQHIHAPAAQHKRPYSRSELDIQQCSCCIGGMIDI